MTQAIMAEWDRPKDLCMLIATPLSHAGAAFLVPTLPRGGTIFCSGLFTIKMRLSQALSGSLRLSQALSGSVAIFVIRG